ncbi:MAG: hypothetical protein AB7F64_00525 [Gammaproteobacteria bacterium]
MAESRPGSEENVNLYKSSPGRAETKEALKGAAGINQVLVGFITNVFVGTLEKLEAQGIKFDEPAKIALMQVLVKSTEDGMASMLKYMKKEQHADKEALQRAFLTGMKVIWNDLQKKANEVSGK